MKRILALTLQIFFLATSLGNGTAYAGPVALDCGGSMTDMSGDPTITFGGSGIPKDAVCIKTFGDLTLGLTAHPRFTNPPVTNDGVDTYFAGSGDDSANGQPNYAIWNFGWFAHLAANATSSANSGLFWDTDPGAGTDVADMGFLMQSLNPGGTIQDSWNLGMGFIDTGVAIPGVYDPANFIFNPYASGVYSFAMTANGVTGAPIGNIGMEVVVGDPVPEPATLIMLGTGLAFIALRGRRRKS